MMTHRIRRRSSKIECMRKASTLSLVGWHIRVKMCDEDYPWDIKINRVIKMDFGFEKYEAEFENGFKVYISPDDLSWVTMRRPVDKIMEGATVLKLQALPKKHLRVVK